MTRKEFDDRVEQIKSMLRIMAERVNGMTLDAVEGVVSADTLLLQRVVQADSQIDEYEARILDDIFQLIVLQSPVSSDARLLASMISIVGELEQAGDDAVKLARRARKLKSGLAPELAAPLGALAESAVQMISDALELVIQYDAQKAQDLIDADEMVDSGYKRARNHVLEFADTQGPLSRELFRTIEIFHALEHVADHAVEIAKRLQKFQRSGTTG